MRERLGEGTLTTPTYRLLPTITMPNAQKHTPPPDYEARVQAMFFRWGAAGGLALLLGFVAEGFLLTSQVQGLEPRMKVLESQLERNCLLIDRLDAKVDAMRNDVTRLTTRDEMTSVE